MLNYCVYSLSRTDTVCLEGMCLKIEKTGFHIIMGVVLKIPNCDKNFLIPLRLIINIKMLILLKL